MVKIDFCARGGKPPPDERIRQDGLIHRVPIPRLVVLLPTFDADEKKIYHPGNSRP
jgi:hypothetical protein